MMARRKREPGMGKARGKSATMPLLDKWDGTFDSKRRLHRDAQLVLRALAAELGLKKSDFDISSNELGPVSGGTIYFHADTWRMWIEVGSGFHPWGASGETDPHESCVLVRRTKGRKDYSGDEENVAIAWELLWDPKKLIEVLRLEGVVRSLEGEG
jgi:hypothetical protein